MKHTNFLCRWNHLRATEGWAILQYHAVLHTTLTVIPPANRRDNEKPPRLHINLSRTLFFTLLSRETVVSSDTLQFNHAEWHTGNVFDLRGACPSSVELPSLPNGATPSAFDLFICGDYEVINVPFLVDVRFSSRLHRFACSVILGRLE